MNREHLSLANIGSVNSNFIFGVDAEGAVIPIQSITQETESAVVVGSIEWLCGRELKATNIIVFDVVDETQGITAKILCDDKEEYRRVFNKLKEGQRIRAKGSIRFDTYHDDFVLFVSSVKEEPVIEHEDRAEIKRVELHTHTQMSEMDSVVPTQELIRTAARWGWDAVAITDHGVVQAFPKAMRTVAEDNLDIKVVYGLEGYLTGDDYKQSPAHHIMILAKNQQGLRNLYRLVSLSHLQFFHHQPRIPKSVLKEHREGLLLGASGCAEGELVHAIVDGKGEEELLAIADFYDYLEIQPCGEEDARSLNRKIAELANKLGKPLVAVGNVHFLQAGDAIYRTIIRVGNGAANAEPQPPLYLRTTDEMLEKFDYLGKEIAFDAVVTNPRRIADMVEPLKPIPDTLHLPTIPDADKTVQETAYQKAHQWYGNPLPDIVQQRLEWELAAVVGHGFSVLYLIAQNLVKKSNEDGYPVMSCGSVGSSLLASLAGITEANPLPPHYRCPKCKYSEFIIDGSYVSGFDMPDKNCPHCGEHLIKDGHDIPAEAFLGLDGSKMPEIALNFANDWQPFAHDCIKHLVGATHVYRAGTVATVQDKTAYAYTRKYYEDKGGKKRDGFIQHIMDGCVGTKKTTKLHPAGLMLVPQNMDVHDFTPLQHPANKTDIEDVATHFDYHDILGTLAKIDVTSHDVPAMIKMLQDMIRSDLATIPFDDSATLSLFRSTEPIGISPEDLGIPCGTLGIPEFRTSYVREIINDTRPTCFSDLVKISGLSHGTNAWFGNAQDLIRDGVCTLHDVIAARDDIFMYLARSGIDPQLSYEIMESMRQGQGIHPDIASKLKNAGVPEWYIESCRKIKFLLPRAHLVSYVMTAFRIAYCKVHYPEAFYSAYFSVRAKTLNIDIVDTIMAGKDAVQTRLKELELMDCLNIAQREERNDLRLAWEMYLRGYTAEIIDHNH